MTLVLLSVFLVSVAQLAMKWGMSHLPLEALAQCPARHPAAFWLDVWPALVAVLTGLGLYALSMLCWVMALGSIPLSLAYPFLSLSYVLVYIGALWLPDMRETFSWLKLSGILLILVGVGLTFHGSTRSVRPRAGIDLTSSGQDRRYRETSRHD